MRLPLARLKAESEQRTYPSTPRMANMALFRWMVMMMPMKMMVVIMVMSEDRAQTTIFSVEALTQSLQRDWLTDLACR